MGWWRWKLKPSISGSGLALAVPVQFCLKCWLFPSLHLWDLTIALFPGVGHPQQKQPPHLWWAWDNWQSTTKVTIFSNWIGFLFRVCSYSVNWCLTHYKLLRSSTGAVFLRFGIEVAGKEYQFCQGWKAVLQAEGRSSPVVFKIACWVEQPGSRLFVP